MPSVYFLFCFPCQWNQIFKETNKANIMQHLTMFFSNVFYDFDSDIQVFIFS